MSSMGLARSLCGIAANRITCPFRAMATGISQPGDLVLDPFCGSGKTLQAVKGCERRYLGIEREEKYVSIALGRLGR